jgi:two-component system cell cycle response regulator
MEKTILVIEDSRTQAMRLKNLLESNGLNTLIASTGHEGLDLAALEQPAVIILDLEMPDMNGLQVCNRLKGDPATAAIPIIMLTRFDTNEVVMRSLETGAVEYIPKDAFADAVLLESLRQMGILNS